MQTILGLVILLAFIIGVMRAVIHKIQNPEHSAAQKRKEQKAREAWERDVRESAERTKREQDASFKAFLQKPIAQQIIRDVLSNYDFNAKTESREDAKISFYCAREIGVNGNRYEISERYRTLYQRTFAELGYKDRTSEEERGLIATAIGSVLAKEYKKRYPSCNVQSMRQSFGKERQSFYMSIPNPRYSTLKD